jgi:rare lipoprotein A
MAARRSLIKLSAFAALLASVLLASTAGLPMTLSAETGIASVYAYSGATTANGETISPGSLTAAHRTLPFGTLVRVTNDFSGDWVVVRINDRGPFIPGRVIYLTPAGADAIGSDGLTHVSIDVIGWSG